MRDRKAEGSRGGATEEEAEATGRPPSRRERYRAETREEVKRIALRQLATSGPSALSINAIGKEMGITGPALYRYFAGRDELLNDLVLDAYDDLGRHVEAAGERSRRRAPRTRMREIANAYRAWALDQPHRYRLLYGEPVPGYPAHTERTIAASQRTFRVFVDALTAIDGRSTHRTARRALAAQFSVWRRRNGYEDTPGRVVVVGVKWWIRLHGFVSLEIEGNFASMAVDPQRFYDDEVSALLRESGG